MALCSANRDTSTVINMRSNLGQALFSILSTGKEVEMEDLFRRYLHIAGFTDSKPTQEAVVAFERALEKYVDSSDRKASDAEIIAKMRRRFWLKVRHRGKNGMDEDKVVPCECCGGMTIKQDATVCVKMNQVMPLDRAQEETVKKDNNHKRSYSNAENNPKKRVKARAVHGDKKDMFEPNVEKSKGRAADKTAGKNKNTKDESDDKARLNKAFIFDPYGPSTSGGSGYFSVIAVD